MEQTLNQLRDEEADRVPAPGSTNARRIGGTHVNVVLPSLERQRIFHTITIELYRSRPLRSQGRWTPRTWSRAKKRANSAGRRDSRRKVGVPPHRPESAALWAAIGSLLDRIAASDALSRAGASAVGR